MQLDDLREQLHHLSAGVPSGSVDADEVYARTRRTVKRRRAARVVASLAVVAMVGTLAVVLNASSTKPKTRINVAGPTTPSTTTSTSSAPPLSITAEQLRAHDGVGAPSGWVPVDEGDARIWIPKDWTLELNGACIGGAASGLVRVGAGILGCQSSEPVPTDAVELLPSTRFRHGKPTLIVHGYRVYLTVPKGIVGPFDRFYEVPQLGVEIVTQNDLADRIVATLAPSARNVALAFAAQPVPRGYRTVTENGVTLSIPRSWTVATPSQLPCVWPSSSGEPELLDIRPGILVPPCPMLPPTAANATRDGVYSYESGSQFAPEPTGRPIAVLRHGASAVTVYAQPRDPNALDVFVRRSGSSTTHALTIGLGRDGRVAGAVLASIDATK